MNTESVIRQAMARRRQRKEKAQRSISSRLATEVNPPSDADIQSKARKAIAQRRQQQEHIHDSMLGRTE